MIKILRIFLIYFSFYSFAVHAQKVCGDSYEQIDKNCINQYSDKFKEVKFIVQPLSKAEDRAKQIEQSYFFKFHVDNFNQKSQTLELAFERNQQGSLNYIYLPNADNVSSLYTIIHENAINKDIPPNDITILGNSISLLKKFEAYYRYSSNERTNTMFETFEMVYRMGLNYLKNNKPEWLQSGIKLIKRQNDKSEARAFNQLCILFTVYDLYEEYEDRFKQKLEFYCNKFKTDTSSFFNYLNKYNEELQAFKKDFGSKRQTNNLKIIRKNKKIHFYMNSGTVKVSTIHSFKGWESETVFLILENFNFKMTFDEILYTGITRTRANLILIN